MMELKKIKLRNFKQFSSGDLNLNDSDNLDILIGPNNSGKTTFMEALTKFLTRKDNNHFFSTYDFPISLHSKLNKKFKKLYELYLKRDKEIDGVDLEKNIEEFNNIYKDFKLLLPYLEIKFEYEIRELPIVRRFLYALDSHQESEKLINFAIMYKPKDINELLVAYHEYLNEIKELEKEVEEKCN